MLISVDLIFKFGKRINVLYLYERLRYEAKSNGGYFDKTKLTKHEQYKLLPLLVGMGWVCGNKITKYRNVLAQEVGTHNYTKIEYDNLKSLEAFRSFIIACTETYLLSWRYKVQQQTGKRFSWRDKEWDRKWVYAGAAIGCEKFNVEKFSDSNFSGRLAESIIADVLGVSPKTIHNWRTTLKINKYNTKRRVNKNIYDIDNSYFSKVIGRFITIDRVIVTNINIFNNKYHKIY